jgi:hypothetical protein
MRNESDISGTESRNTHFGSSNFFFENHAAYEIMWKKKIVQPGTPQMTDNMAHALAHFMPYT